jgi:hypothetical protein
MHWSTAGEGWRHAEAGAARIEGAEPCPVSYQPDRLDEALALLDDYFAQEPREPPPDTFAVLTPESLRQSATKKNDPALGDGFFLRCGEVWQKLRAMKRDLRAAALTEATAFAREQVRQAKFTAQVPPMTTCSARCTVRC